LTSTTTVLRGEVPEYHSFDVKVSTGMSQSTVMFFTVSSSCRGRQDPS